MSPRSNLGGGPCGGRSHPSTRDRLRTPWRTASMPPPASPAATVAPAPALPWDLQSPSSRCPRRRAVSEQPRQGERLEAATPLLQAGPRVGGALVRPGLPDAGGGGIVARTAPAAHGLHRARGRVRRAGCAVVPVRLRAGSSNELAARRTALLAYDARCRRDGDTASIGLAQKGLRLPFLVAERPYPLVPGTDVLREAMGSQGRWWTSCAGRQEQTNVGARARPCGHQRRTVTACPGALG